jgi:hypothetical protein
VKRGHLFFRGPVSAAQRYLRETAPSLQLDNASVEDPRQMRLLEAPAERCECAHGRGVHVQGIGACTSTRACDCPAFRRWVPPEKEGAP